MRERPSWYDPVRYIFLAAFFLAFWWLVAWVLVRIAA